MINFFFLQASIMLTDQLSEESSDGVSNEILFSFLLERFINICLIFNKYILDKFCYNLDVNKNIFIISDN